jgi:Na+/melibiose symporter-like transporter
VTKTRLHFGFYTAMTTIVVPHLSWAAEHTQDFNKRNQVFGMRHARVVIDYDELVTGERKEGAYFALWNFAQKSASGITLMVTGFVTP